MKKVSDPVYRREVRDWFKDHPNLPVADLSRKMKLSTSAIYGWINGVSVPEPKNFGQMKAIISGTNIEELGIEKPPEWMKEILTRIEGRLDQVTKQIEDLRADLTRADDRVSALEHKKKDTPVHR